MAKGRFCHGKQKGQLMAENFVKNIILCLINQFNDHSNSTIQSYIVYN